MSRVQFSSALVAPAWRAHAGVATADGATGAAACQTGPMSSSDTPYVPLAERDLAALVPDWFDWAQAADALGVSVTSLRTMIRDHELAGAVPVAGAGQRVPADFFQDGLVVKGLSGLITMLHDHNWSDREIIAWLFTDDDLPGRPIDALRENRGSEVKRRAQSMAF